jgi:hypothetical protein
LQFASDRRRRFTNVADHLRTEAMSGSTVITAMKGITILGNPAGGSVHRILAAIGWRTGGFIAMGSGFWWKGTGGK